MPGRGPIHGHINATVAVVVTSDGDIVADTPGVGVAACIGGRGLEDVPRPTTRTIERNVSFPVAIEIRGGRQRNGPVACDAEGAGTAGLVRIYRDGALVRVRRFR